MSDNDMNNIMNQINNMIKNTEIPDDLKSIINGFKPSSNSSNKNTKLNGSGKSNYSQNSSSENSKDNSSEIPDIDINTILKMKQIMDSMNSNKDDPRANLLMSLKPYLKDSRKQKVDQYVKLFGLGKAFELFGSLGGENKNDV